LVATWQAYRAAIPWVIARQQFNLLGSHDTARILHVVSGDSALNRLAAAFLLTYVGVPCIYYGDEIGMTAPDSLGARDCMIWDASLWNNELRTFYQTLINLRRTSPALIDGGFQILLAEQDVLAYMRDTDNEQIIVIGNRGTDVHSSINLFVRDGGIPDSVVFEEIFTGQTSMVKQGNLPLPSLPTGVQVWRSKS
jgi:alpha-glucosidase